MGDEKPFRYRTDMVTPDGYMVVCPECDHRYEAPNITGHRCPECGNEIVVNP